MQSHIDVRSQTLHTITLLPDTTTVYCINCFYLALEAFSLQELWTFARLPNNVVDFYTEVSIVQMSTLYTY